MTSISAQCEESLVCPRQSNIRKKPSGLGLESKEAWLEKKEISEGGAADVASSQADRVVQVTQQAIPNQTQSYAHSI
jgi:hypothetical protein